ncbi:hypothetical protein Ahy_B08g094397 [Arachis hypogaea]|uniref:Protein kinase domain-containing protein n=1 Tax=Arachis hypogaea TaxID=3818 RepID=A0A444Y8U4_ARAHY|nr:hypothetical protein Ahy_B08g094397 [Arachis hypogaea]
MFFGSVSSAFQSSWISFFSHLKSTLHSFVGLLVVVVVVVVVVVMMSREQHKRGKEEKGSDGAEKVIVAVKASKEIPKTALVWSLTHVVQPGDCITLIVVVPSSQSFGRRLWGFPRFAGDCANTQKKSHSPTSSEQKSEITDSFSQMILQLHDIYDPNKINVKIKIVSGSPCGAVAAEARKAQANWVVLDKQLKQEEKQCMEELHCNIVVMKQSQAKVLRLNLNGSQKKDLEEAAPLHSKQDGKLGRQAKNKNDSLSSIKGAVVTPTSSPDVGTPSTATEAGTSSVSSSDPGTSPFFVSEMNNGESKKEETIKRNEEVDASSDSDSEKLSLSSATLRFQPWIKDLLLCKQSSQCREEGCHSKNQTSTARALMEKFSRLEREAEMEISSHMNELDLSGNVREAITLSRNAPPGPPPLCSICQHKAPVFGKPPRWFSYAELELATSGFSQANFLAEGGFGSVHRGVLPDGQEPLEWSARQRIAVGAARGLRYLHEECRVGCIIHRDMRPNNILITHDFEPLVGDFGLARWQQHRDTGVETRVIGTFGYLAPEYAQSGQITEKADVYSFGVVLVELVTGRKAVDLSRPKGQQCLTEWARPLLAEYAIEELIDPRLGNNYAENEVNCMLHAASLCMRRDPYSRPRMSQNTVIFCANSMDSEAEPPETENPPKRHKCSACYKQYKKKEHLIEHMKISYHSLHQPRCGVCQKHCKSFESLREHLTGPLPKGLCATIFSQQGCQLCLSIFDSAVSLREHLETCRLSSPAPMGTDAMPYISSQIDDLDSYDENGAGGRPRAIAMDCEMVGGGSDGTLEICARVCLVDEDENLIFHTYVQPIIPVTNYRYDITGLTEENLRNAMPLKEVQKNVLQILYNGESTGKVLDGGKARLLVGHDLEHDFDCLKLNYPKHLLSYDIQSGAHDPYEDCISVMRLYKRIRGQIHKEEGYGTLTSNNNIGKSDCWESEKVSNLTPDELYAMSRSDYRCWCLDLRPNLAP